MAIDELLTPTPEMVAAGWRAWNNCPDKDSDIIEPIFEAMIRVALDKYNIG